jgi:hypothetical protein
MAETDADGSRRGDRGYEKEDGHLRRRTAEVLLLR